MRGLNEPVRAEPDAEQGMLLVVDRPSSTQSLEREPDLTCLADHRLQQLGDYLAVHSATLRRGQAATPHVPGHEAGCRCWRTAEPAGRPPVPPLRPVRPAAR